MQDKLLGRDLKLVDSLAGKDLVVRNGDLVLVENLDNLVQALSLRLQSHRGILKQLGHPNYGSRLVEAIGTVNNQNSLRRVENLVREAVLQEPRVQSIASLNIRPLPSHPGMIEIDVSVLPIREPVPLNLVVTLAVGDG